MPVVTFEFSSKVSCSIGRYKNADATRKLFSYAAKKGYDVTAPYGAVTIDSLKNVTEGSRGKNYDGRNEY